MYKKNFASASYCTLPKNVLLRLLVMFKLALLFVLLSLSPAWAVVFAQRATIEGKNLSLKSVFSSLREQTGYHFLYIEDDISSIGSIDAKFIDKPLNEILDALLKDSGFTYEIRKTRVLIEPRKALPQAAESTLKQQRQVSGKVISETAEVLAGVTVSVKGTAISTKTDEDGQYSIRLEGDNPILVFSIVGFQSKEVRASSATINVTLDADVSDLDEVVVVGYGTQKKETLTGSVTSINSDAIKTTKSENLINNIQGKMPGLLIRQQTGEPGTFDNMVSIRGYGAPLVVIDGVVRDGTADLAQLNPEDVESISVLKDAAAAIYGMNAANGVIIVTTKKGLSGKTQFSYSNLLGLKRPTGMEPTVDALTYRIMANEMQRNIGAAPTYSEEILDKYRNNEPGYSDHDWIDMFMHKQTFTQQHVLSARGGTDKIRYFNSLGYTEDNGLLKSNIQYYKRFNLRSNLSSNLTDNLKLDVSISGRVDRTQAPREEFLWTYKTLVVNDRGKNYHTIDNPNHLSAIDPENKNPFALVDPDMDGYRRRRNTQYQSTTELTYTAPFAPGLTLAVLGAYDGWLGNNSQLQKAYRLYDYYTDDFVTNFGTNQYSNDVRLFQRVYGRAQANYNKSWSDHSLIVTGVAEVTSTRSDYLRGARQYTDLYTHDIIDQGTSTTASNAGNRSFGRTAAFIGRANYNYKGKYLFEAVARYDGSYRYSPEKRWAFFPSLSAGWRISEEAFIKDNLPFISDLKIRGSYGKSGRDAGNAFEYVAGYLGGPANGYVFNSDGSLTIGMRPPGVVNNNLGWVSSKISNIGLDLELWGGKLGGVVEVFERRNEGLLATRVQSVPNTFGATFPQENINSDLNRGIEFSVSHRNTINEDFNYSVSANFTYARLKQLHDERADFTSSWDRWKNGNENRYTGRMWLYDYNGYYTSLDQYETAPLMGGNQGNSKMLPGSYAIIDANGDGIINENDQMPNHWTFGAVNPPIQFGLNMSAKYKLFDINLLWQGAAGYSINYRNNDIWGYGRYPTLHEKFLDRWHPTNPADDPYNPTTQWTSGYYPAIRSNTDNTTDQHVVDVWRPSATYLRLKSVELGYSFSSDLVKRIGVSNVRVFANGFNLLTFTRRELRKADPERQEKDWDANLTYPLMKSYNLGLYLNF